VKLGSLLRGRRITEELDEFDISIWKFAYSELWKKIPEPMCEELQLLKISAFILSGEISVNNQFTRTTSSECSPHF
jgi:hypothetical protein